MDRGFADDGTLNDIPWTAVFDPAANARALSAIQAQGFQAASELVDRFLNLAQSAGDRVNGDPTGAKFDESTTGAPPGVDADVILSTWWSLFGRLLRATPGAVSARGGTAAFDLANEHASGAVQLDADRSGPVSAEVWLHNSSTDEMANVVLRCSELLSHDGASLPAAAVRFTPDQDVHVPARSNRGVTVTVEVEQGLPPGRYRGTLLASGHPDVWLPVLLTMRAPIA